MIKASYYKSNYEIVHLHNGNNIFFHPAVERTDFKGYNLHERHSSVLFQPVMIYIKHCGGNSVKMYTIL